MNHDFLMGVCAATLTWACVFLLHLDWNIRNLAKLMVSVDGLREMHKRLLAHMWQHLHRRTTRIAYLEDVLKRHDVVYSPDPAIFDDPFPSTEERQS